MVNMMRMTIIDMLMRAVSVPIGIGIFLNDGRC